MSRYKKTIVNELEFKEIGGQTALCKPTIEDVFEANVIFKNVAIKKDLDMMAARKLIAKTLWQGCFVWKDNRPTEQKIDSEAETKYEDIDNYVAKHVIELWAEFLEKAEIVDKKAIKKMQDEALKIKEQEEKN